MQEHSEINCNSLILPEISGMEWHKRLTELVRDRAVSLAKVERAAGLNRNRLSDMLAGHEPRVTDAVRVCLFFGVAVEDLFAPSGKTPVQKPRPSAHALRAFALSRGAWHSRKSIKLLGPSSLIEAEDFKGQGGFVPVVAPIAAGEPREAHDGDFAAGAADAYVAFDVDDENAFALRVDGDSMKPDFLHGDIIIASPRSRSSREATHRDGMLGVVIFGSERTATFKVVRFGAVNKSADEPMDYVLQPLNAAFPPMRLRRGEVSAIYPVVGLVRKE